MGDRSGSHARHPHGVSDAIELNGTGTNCSPEELDSMSWSSSSKIQYSILYLSLIIGCDEGWLDPPLSGSAV